MTSKTDGRMYDDALQIRLQPLLTRIRRHLHMYPEVGLQEHDTAIYIREVLEQYGIDVSGSIAGTGLYVDIVGRQPGPTIGYRADIDALPIQDCKTVPYASKNPGVAHLCGHDAHTTIGIGVALLLHQWREDLTGTVRVFFQPNEESSPSGATLMIRDGVLDSVDAVYAVHMDPGLAVGRYGLITGAATAAADRFRVRVQSSTTGHSARPHLFVDTMWAAVQVANTFYQLLGRVTDPRSAAVITICRFEGGGAYNVMPSETCFGGTFRSTDPEERLMVHRKMKEAAQDIAAMCGAEVEVIFDQGVPAVINDGRMIENVARTAEEEYGADAVYRIPLPSMGGEDFAHYMQHVPGALVRVGSRSSDATGHPLHDARFDIDEACLGPAAHLMSRVLMRHLEQAGTSAEVAS